jgi:hypothetical protein
MTSGAGPETTALLGLLVSASLPPDRWSDGIDGAVVARALPPTALHLLLAHSTSTESASAAAGGGGWVAAGWSAGLMLVLVGLLVAWEQSVKLLRERVLPPPLLPVLNSALGEMGGLGFVGLVLGAFVTGGGVLGSGEWLREVSRNSLGEPDVLVETFEFLHLAFFQVAMTYFVASGLVVYQMLRQISLLDQVTEMAQSVPDFDCPATLVALGLVPGETVNATAAQISAVDMREESAARLDPRLVARPPPSLAEGLLVRERLVQSFNLSSAGFRVENYLGGLVGERLEALVELAPCTWLPLVPALTQGRSVDVARGAVSASSANALESCGCFLASTGFVATSILFAVLGVVWGGWNRWKMGEIKKMLLPTVRVVEEDSGEMEGGSTGTTRRVVVADPPYLDPEQFARFDSSPGLLGAVESFVASWHAADAEPKEEEQTTWGRHRLLFGRAGPGKGPELYLHSIKFHAWLVTTQLVFWGGQIVARDLSALPLVLGRDAAPALRGVGRPDLVVPELALYGALVLAALAQLVAVVPAAFLDYNVVTSVEEMADVERLRASCCRVGILRGRDEA